MKTQNIRQMWLDKQCQTNREVLRAVHWQLLQPLTYKHNPSAGSRYYKVLFADGNFRCGKPVLAAWLAVCGECSKLHDLERDVYFEC
jgi:hypothetical protein